MKYLAAVWCDERLGWIEFKILELETNNVIAYKAWIYQDATLPMIGVMAIAKAAQIIHTRKGEIDSVVYCNCPEAVKWANDKALVCDLSGLPEGLVEKLNSAMEFLGEVEVGVEVMG